MEKLVEFLEKNNIEYDCKMYGNDTYFKDGFTCEGISVKFDYEIAENREELHKKESFFLRYLKRNKKLAVYTSGICGRCIPYYNILNAQDAEKVKEQEKRIKEESEKFWLNRHIA